MVVSYERSRNYMRHETSDILNGVCKRNPAAGFRQTEREVKKYGSFSGKEGKKYKEKRISLKGTRKIQLKVNKKKVFLPRRPFLKRLQCSHSASELFLQCYKYKLTVSEVKSALTGLEFDWLTQNLLSRT